MSLILSNSWHLLCPVLSLPKDPDVLGKWYSRQEEWAPDGGQKTPDVHCVAQGNIDLRVEAGDGPVHNMWVDSIFNLFHLSWEHSF